MCKDIVFPVKVTGDYYTLAKTASNETIHFTCTVENTNTNTNATNIKTKLGNQIFTMTYNKDQGYWTVDIVLTVEGNYEWIILVNATPYAQGIIIVDFLPPQILEADISILPDTNQSRVTIQVWLNHYTGTNLTVQLNDSTYMMSKDNTYWLANITVDQEGNYSVWLAGKQLFQPLQNISIRFKVEYMLTRYNYEILATSSNNATVYLACSFGELEPIALFSVLNDTQINMDYNKSTDSWSVIILIQKEGSYQWNLAYNSSKQFLEVLIIQFKKNTSDPSATYPYTPFESSIPDSHQQNILDSEVMTIIIITSLVSLFATALRIAKKRIDHT